MSISGFFPLYFVFCVLAAGIRAIGFLWRTAADKEDIKAGLKVIDIGGKHCIMGQKNSYALPPPAEQARAGAGEAGGEIAG